MVYQSSSPKADRKFSRNAYSRLDPSFNLSKGKLKIHKQNTFRHELAKFLVMWEEIENGGEVVAEARFMRGGRADIYNITSDTAIEIVNTESEKSIERKENEYPCDKVIFLTADKVIDNWRSKL